MKYFESPEGNLIFSTAIIAENTIRKLEKKFENKELNVENYVVKRQKLLKIIEQFKNYIEQESNILNKKSFHQTRRKINAK